jgi:hypothetical protein
MTMNGVKTFKKTKKFDFRGLLNPFFMLLRHGHFLWNVLILAL